MYTCYHYREQIRILACLRTASFHRVSKQTETVKVDISDKVEYSQHYSCTEAKKRTKSSRLKCNKTHISFIYFLLGQRSRITVFQFSTPLADHLAACKCSVNQSSTKTPHTLNSDGHPRHLRTCMGKRDKPLPHTPCLAIRENCEWRLNLKM